MSQMNSSLQIAGNTGTSKSVPNFTDPEVIERRKEDLTRIFNDYYPKIERSAEKLARKFNSKFSASRGLTECEIKGKIIERIVNDGMRTDIFSKDSQYSHRASVIRLITWTCQGILRATKNTVDCASYSDILSNDKESSFDPIDLAKIYIDPGVRATHTFIKLANNPNLELTVNEEKYLSLRLEAAQNEDTDNPVELRPWLAKKLGITEVALDLLQKRLLKKIRDNYASEGTLSNLQVYASTKDTPQKIELLKKLLTSAEKFKLNDNSQKYLEARIGLARIESGHSQKEIELATGLNANKINRCLRLIRKAVIALDRQEAHQLPRKAA